MSSLRPDILVNPSDLFIQTGNVVGTVPYMTQVPELGVRSVTGDGREFRYVQAGATALVMGYLQQAPALSSNLQGVAWTTASAVGATSVTLTISTGTAITAGQFSGGFLSIIGHSGTTATDITYGAGQMLKISTNTAVTASGTSITFTLEDPIAVAVTTSAFATIFPPVYAGVIVAPGTITNVPVGIAINNLTASYYGWVQVKGIATALIAGTPAVGTGLSSPVSGTAGALQVTAATYTNIATNLVTGTDTRFGLVDLMIS